SHGQRRLQEPGAAISLGTGQTIDGIDVSLPRAGAITVRVTDEAGAPVPGVRIFVQRFGYAPDGQRRLTNVPAGGRGLLDTDDRGEARAFGSPPGEYVLRAEP